MNSSPRHSDQSDFGGVGCDTGIFCGVLFLSMIITAASYICIHGTQHPSIHFPIRGSIAIELGLDEAILASYPKLLYSQAKLQNKVNNSLVSSCCSICLGDYEDSDMIRLLPDCGLTFHPNCVDCWLRLNPTCPICQNLPVPSLSTPLAEVAALAASIY